jgi:hypothetical protein
MIIDGHQNVFFLTLRTSDKISYVTFKKLSAFPIRTYDTKKEKIIIISLCLQPF